MSKKEVKTIAEKTEYKGSPILAIYEVKEDGTKKSEWPIISFGANKASAILNHVQEIENFLAGE